MCSKLFLIFLLSAVLLKAVQTTDLEGIGWDRFTNLGDKEEDCNGGRCLYGLDVNLRESSSRRRQFEYSESVSYACLRPDAVPCGYRGHSYYNCRKGAYVNPYTRSCDVISQCYRRTS
ncbi:protein RALF-like 1 [Pistacia vera]|uniref:Uncharacterized protein n=2 Tax=Pistacia TaxID=55512 RepID=A0ACC1A0C7_9ROSI|nr:protein RALF-like 1 [Pistacia vera]XP_031266509.1 protein RALF-like 1 [Pistacia vera]KAJ0018798.1 hypothetical protein Pint_10553 [Pistacia integerrima]KAJ0080703.1 hypothetical protein Patl1_10683 [Pistacia atlantica]